MKSNVTPRDQKLLHQLGDFGVLSTGQIRELFFPEIAKTTMLRRLRILEQWDLIRRLRGLSDGSHGWCLSQRCATALGFVGIGRRLNRHTLEHDVTLSQVRLALGSVGLGTQWTPEHVLRNEAWRARKPHTPEPENIPDGVLAIEVEGKFLAVAVELELSAKNKDRYRKALKAYWWKHNLALIWYLVPHEALGRKLEHIWHEVTSGGPDIRLRWSIIEQVLKRPYDIVLRRKGGTRLLREITPMKPPDAHEVAHPMSSPDREMPSNST